MATGCATRWKNWQKSELIAGSWWLKIARNSSGGSQLFTRASRKRFYRPRASKVSDSVCCQNIKGRTGADSWQLDLVTTKLENGVGRESKVNHRFGKFGLSGGHKISHKLRRERTRWKLAPLNKTQSTSNGITKRRVYSKSRLKPQS